MIDVRFLWTLVLLGLITAQDAPEMNSAGMDVSGAHLFNPQMWAMPQVRFASPMAPEGSVTFDHLEPLQPAARMASYQEAQYAPQYQPQFYHDMAAPSPTYRSQQEPQGAEMQNLMGDMGKEDDVQAIIMDDSARTKGKKGKGKKKGKGHGRMASAEAEEDDSPQSAYRTKGLKGHGSDDNHESHHYQPAPVFLLPAPVNCGSSGRYHVGYGGHFGGMHGYAREASAPLNSPSANTAYSPSLSPYQEMNWPADMRTSTLGRNHHPDMKPKALNSNTNRISNQKAPESEKDASTTDEDIVGFWNPNLNKPFLGLHKPPPPPQHHFSNLGALHSLQQLPTQ